MGAIIVRQSRAVAVERGGEKGVLTHRRTRINNIKRKKAGTMWVNIWKLQAENFPPEENLG